MNGITVTLKDKTKTAYCRETVALCAKYELTVSPALEVDESKTETIDGVLTSTVKGYIVLHRRYVGHTTPDGAVRYIAGQQVADQNYQWDTNEVYGYSELTTRQIDGKWVTTGELDLRTKTLCRDFIQKFGANANAPLKFAVYDPVAGGLVGEGDFDVKVVEPYYVTSNQSLTLFKGDKGDKGDKGEDGHVMTWDTMSDKDKVNLINAVVADERTKGEKGEGLEWNTMTAEDIAALVDILAGDGRFKGADGAKGAKGDKGDSYVSDGQYLYDISDNKWHKASIFRDPTTNDRTVVVDEVGIDENPALSPPAITMSKVGKILTVTVKSMAGIFTETISDGNDGATGIQGNKGDKGDKGNDGKDGIDGDSSYGVNAIGSTASANLQNGKVNTLTCSGASLALTLPSAPASGKMRDLVVYITGRAGGSTKLSVSGYTSLVTDDAQCLSDGVAKNAKVMLIFSEVSSGVFAVARKDLASL